MNHPYKENSCLVNNNNNNMAIIRDENVLVAEKEKMLL